MSATQADRRVSEIREPRNLLETALRASKREVVEEAMGKGESWVKKLLAGESGVLLADLPRLLAHHNLKIVRSDLRCVDAQLLASYETIVRRVVANDRRSLFDDEAE